MKITQKQLKRLFDYHRDGYFIEKTRRGMRSIIGGRVMGREHTKKPYLRLCLGGKHYYLHRLVYLWHRGSLPKQVDHIDQDVSNNRIENLRAATPALNRVNQKARRDNRSGFKGVTQQGGTFISRITFKKKCIFLGRFKTKEAAARQYNKAAKRFYGKFACLNDFSPK